MEKDYPNSSIRSHPKNHRHLRDEGRTAQRLRKQFLAIWSRANSHEASRHRLAMISANGGWEIPLTFGSKITKSCRFSGCPSRTSVARYSIRQLWQANLNDWNSKLWHYFATKPLSNTHISCVQRGTCRSRKMDVCFASNAGLETESIPNFRIPRWIERRSIPLFPHWFQIHFPNWFRMFFSYLLFCLPFLEFPIQKLYIPTEPKVWILVSFAQPRLLNHRLKLLWTKIGGSPTQNDGTPIASIVRLSVYPFVCLFVCLVG